VTIVMGLDQHRAQITADGIDTSTGEVSRARVAPAHRAGVREFVSRFRGQELEVALEATTGWRFVLEELRRVGAVVHLAEPAETAARTCRSVPGPTRPQVNVTGPWLASPSRSWPACSSRPECTGASS
jgi:hypothetical protein